MNNNGLVIYPLYWIYHDNWFNREWSHDRYRGWESHDTIHYGHMHFFMPDYGFKNNSLMGKAYEGSQTFNFSLESLCGPNSGDINDAKNVEIVGTPKWYFEVTEYWRRVYIQPWDDKNQNVNIESPILRKGIKYDASHADHTYGPFREGKNFFFMWSQHARALPIEYYKSSDFKTRDNILLGDTYELPRPDDEKYEPTYTKFAIPNGGTSERFMTRFYPKFDSYWLTDVYTPEEAESQYKRASMMGAIYNPETQRYEYSYSFGSFQKTFGDMRYLYPVIEYQKVKQLDFERLEGWQVRDANGIGDGFEVSITLPFKKNGKIQSPFSSESGVSPYGTYHNNFDINNPDKIRKYPLIDKCDIDWGRYDYVLFEGENESSIVQSNIHMHKSSIPGNNSYNNPRYVYRGQGRNTDTSLDEYRTPDELKGTNVMFRIPEGMTGDGIWVEQFLGGVVRAKAEVKWRDNFGGEKTSTVTTTKFFLNEEFEGLDQGQQ